MTTDPTTDDTQPSGQPDAQLAEMNRLKDMAARAQADLQNAKVRLEREAADIRAFAQQGLVEKLLPTVDNFQRAFTHLPEELQSNEWVQGVQAVEKQLIADLKSAGLETVPALDQPVDPSLHEVLQMAPGPKDTVIQVLEHGYVFNGKILRPAKVIVGNGEQQDG